MKSISILILAAMVFMSLAGCSDAQKAQWSGLGSPQDIVCYSGGVEIFRGISTGKVMAESTGNIFFEDADTHTIVEIRADCVVTARKLKFSTAQNEN